MQEAASELLRTPLPKLSGKCSEGDLACVFGFKKRPMEASAPPLGGPRSTDSRPAPIFQTVSPRTSVNSDIGLRQRAPPAGIMAMVEWAQTHRVRPAGEEYAMEVDERGRVQV